MGEPEDIFASYYPTPWYKNFWKVLILIIVSIVGIAAILFGVLVYMEWRNIQSGEAPIYVDDELTGTASGNVNQTKNQFSGTSSTNNATALNFVPGIDDDPYLGTSDAPVEIFAFEDFQCPYCRAAVPIIKQVVEDNLKNVHFVYRDFPLYTIHPQARSAAQAAECADDQGSFWPYHDLLYANQSELATAGIFTSLAKQAGLNIELFEQCVVEQRYVDEVQRDLDEGLLSGVSATPTFIINGTKYQGVLSESQFQDIIDSELAGN